MAITNCVFAVTAEYHIRRIEMVVKSISRAVGYALALGVATLGANSVHAAEKLTYYCSS